MHKSWSYNVGRGEVENEQYGDAGAEGMSNDEFEQVRIFDRDCPVG